MIVLKIYMKIMINKYRISNFINITIKNNLISFKFYKLIAKLILLLVDKYLCAIIITLKISL